MFRFLGRFERFRSAFLSEETRSLPTSALHTDTEDPADVRVLQKMNIGEKIVRLSEDGSFGVVIISYFGYVVRKP